MDIFQSSVPLTVSAIICTRNRVNLLESAVLSLIKQDFEPTRYEIIVVDNGSEDGTCDLISAYFENILTHRIMYVYEGNLGISWARNAGWRVARGKYVAYIDDDERAEPDWLRLLVTALEEHPKPVVAVGGPIYLDWGGDRPDWLPISLEKFYSKVDLGNEARNLGLKEYPLTSNLAIRREFFDELEGFRTDLGHVGNIPIGGEDVELIDRIHAIGKKIYYEPKAVVYHHVPKSRQRRKWLLRRCYYGGRSTPILDNLKQVKVKEILYNIRLALLYLLRTLLSLIRNQERVVVENGCALAIKLGRAVGLIRLYFIFAIKPVTEVPSNKIKIE